MIIILIIIISYYISQEISAKSNRVSLPFNQLFKTKHTDMSTIETDQDQASPGTKVSSNFIIPTSHPKLYELSPSKDPTKITTLCLYKPKEQKEVRHRKGYGFDTYLNTYVSQHPIEPERTKQKKIPYLSSS